MASISSTREMSFTEPTRQIIDLVTLERFGNSPVRAEIVSFVESVSDALKIQTANHEMNPAVLQTFEFLDTIEAQMVQTTCTPVQRARYGDPDFRTWLAKLQPIARDFFKTILKGKNQLADVELMAYMLGSFGEPVRLDYGTGHELCFCALLLCCSKLNVFSSEDLYDIGAFVFPKYNQVARKVILRYRLEPAGSRGSWGLDDYFFLPFYWGSAQLSGQNLLPPSAICDDHALKMLSSSYMYFASVSFVKQIKGSPLSLTAPMLYDISAVKSWSKINSGLLKMYQAEYLSRLPMMQHFLFGNILRFT